MRIRTLLVLGLFATPAGLVVGSDEEPQSGGKKVASIETKSFYDFTVKKIDGSDVSLSDYKDKLCLVVNVASR